MADVGEDVLRELYSVPPDEFMQRRGELAAAARADGDSSAAAAIGKLRKPTVGAWIVNALVHDQPATVGTLTDLGGRMRAAQDNLDATKLRELSTERRKLVDRLTADAFRKAGRTDPPAGLRDEVSGTLDAAIADADVAARLGTLQRSEQWSGFGFLPTSTPQLTVVKGGKDERPAKKASARPKAPAQPKESPAERRRKQRSLHSARDTFADADAALSDATDAERDLQNEVKQLTKRLARLQTQLDDARAQLEQARKDVTAARSKRREARSALDRAERDADS